MIAATQIYDYVQCPHRVRLDLYGDPNRRDAPNAFVELLWESGNAYEKQVAQQLPISIDLSKLSAADRERETLAAMARGESLIYSGRLSSGDLVGAPDLLERTARGYVPGDIKSGSGLEGDEDEGKLKKRYAFQLAHYVKILEAHSMAAGREAFVIDRSGDRIAYALNERQGVKKAETWWEAYEAALAEVRVLVGGGPSLPALSSTCKLCHWYRECKATLIAADDLTLIAELGRSKRDAIAEQIPTVQALADANVQRYVTGKKTAFRGVGPDSLVKFHERAKLLKQADAKPYLKSTVALPMREREVFFDIEADPMRGFVYLHGFIERMTNDSASEVFKPFFADSLAAAAEEEIFAEAWKYLQMRRADSVVYYYSKYERTAYRELASKYPAVCAVADVDQLFSETFMVDLYLDVVKPCTEWPTYDQSIKTLAQYSGFAWRDTHPSGAASIEWFHRWIETGDPLIKTRILEYNEDDCRATGVVLDKIRSLT